MSDLRAFLNQHLSQHQLPATLGQLICDIAQVCTTISRHVRAGDLGGVLGEAGSGNIQGEAQKKLDVLANQLLCDTLQAQPDVAGLASEEEDNFIAAHANGRYLVLFDPLDGSSNTDVNISVGTIVSILEKPAGELSTQSFLQAGRLQVASLYVLYGPQTQLVLTVKHGVFAFTLNENNSFMLCRSQMQIPEQTQEFAINMSNQRHWYPPVQQYIAQLLAGKEGERGKNYNMRWVASMVAEVHRILMRGGVFLYPRDGREPEKAGKLRLMYEANPLGLIVEQAGGGIHDNQTAMLDIQPTGLHQRVAVVLGSREETEFVLALHHK